jgi:hypothetical protein
LIPEELIPDFQPGELNVLRETIISRLPDHEAGNALHALEASLLGWEGQAGMLRGTIAPKSYFEQLSRALGPEFGEVLNRFGRLPPKLTTQLLDFANFPRAVLASWDFSATARQGLILSIMHPTKVPRAFWRQMRAFASEKLALQMDDALRLTDDAISFQRNGGYLAPLRPGALLRKREESFMSSFAERIPGVRRSERAYITYLNEMRVGTYKTVSSAWTAMGAQEEDLKGLARFINVASGRGNISKNLETYSPLLNTMMFSPRLQLSRLQLIKMAVDSNPYVRKEAWKALGLFLGTGTALLTLLKHSGVADVELDPRSADFGKIKIGDTRLDIWTGYVQYARFMAQMLTGERKTAYGNMTKAERERVAWRFVQSKSSPAFGLLVDLLRGENYMGEELFADTSGAIRTFKNRFLPLFVQDMMDAAEQSGVNGMMTALPAGIGVGVLTYVNDYSRVKNQIARQMGFEDWEDIDPKTQANLLRTNPTLIRATRNFDNQVMGTQWGDWRLAGNAIEDTFTENVEKATNQFRQTHDGYKFREKIADAFTARRGSYQSRSKDPRFREIVLRLETPQTPEEIAELGPEQMAIRIYNDAMWGDDMYDEFGDYRFDEAEVRRQQLEQNLGPDLLDYVEQYRGLRFADLPYEFQMLAQAKKVMKPYWQVRDWVVKNYGKAWADSPTGQRFIAKIRKQLRMSNPELNQYYNLFYTKT